LSSEFSLTLFLSAVFEVILELLLRIKLRSAHRALVRLARFMFFCHISPSFLRNGYHLTAWLVDNFKGVKSYRVPSLIGLMRLEHDFYAPVYFVEESFIRLGGILQRQAVRDHEAWVDLSVLDFGEQRLHVVLNVRLAAFERQRLVHERAEGNFIVIPAIDAGDRYRATFSAGEKRLAKDMGPVAL
jgi:hypothetical protein